MSYLIFITIIVNLAICIPFTKKNSKIRSILYIALALTITIGVIIFTVQHFKIVLSVLGFIFLVVLAAFSQDNTDTLKRNKTVTNKYHQNSSQNNTTNSSQNNQYKEESFSDTRYLIIFKYEGAPDNIKNYKLPIMLTFKCTSLNEIEHYKHHKAEYLSEAGWYFLYTYASYYPISSLEFNNNDIPYINEINRTISYKDI